MSKAAGRYSLYVEALSKYTDYILRAPQPGGHGQVSKADASRQHA